MQQYFWKNFELQLIVIVRHRIVCYILYTYVYLGIMQAIVMLCHMAAITGILLKNNSIYRQLTCLL